jgi:endonuclease YncB( thermonuclease family)
MALRLPSASRRNNNSWSNLEKAGPVRAASIAIVLTCLLSGPGLAQVTGAATVLSSDTIIVGGQTFRLFGIDGIEFHQFCYVDGEPWACGASATRALQILMEFPVTCEPRGERDGVAVYAACATAEGDVAEIMVRQGWAAADRARSDNYAAIEDAARAGGEGAWRGIVAEPGVFRDDMAAIEQRYMERELEILPAAAEDALLADGAVPIFEGIGTTPSAAIAPVGHEVRVAWPVEGFILGAIPERGVFDWRTPVTALATWRQQLLQRIRSAAATSVWLTLAEHASNVLEVDDDREYYAAIVENAAPWTAEGRQPVIGIPEWVSSWFSGNAPEGAEIVLKEGVTGPGYLGTIDGIDVYFGEAPDAASYLFPADLLLAVGYAPFADGEIVQFDVAAGVTAEEALVRYRQIVEWRAEPIVTVQYPYEPPPDNPYGS